MWHILVLPSILFTNPPVGQALPNAPDTIAIPAVKGQAQICNGRAVIGNYRCALGSSQPRLGG